MERVIDLHNRGELKPYVYRMAWQTYNGRLGQFYLKYRYRPEIEKETTDDINLYDIIEESNLTSIERHWLNVYIDHDCNKTWMESNTKICRKAITKNIKTIIDKCRK
jgi:hypothetical protein